MTNEEFTRFIIEILQEDIKEDKLFIERREINEDKSEVTMDFIFDIRCCPKKMRVTFNYNEFSNRINCKESSLEN